MAQPAEPQQDQPIRLDYARPSRPPPSPWLRIYFALLGAVFLLIAGCLLWFGLFEPWVVLSALCIGCSAIVLLLASVGLLVERKGSFRAPDCRGSNPDARQ